MRVRLTKKYLAFPAGATINLPDREALIRIRENGAVSVEPAASASVIDKGPPADKAVKAASVKRK